MKVHLLKRQTISEYCNLHANARKPFEEFLAKLKIADWGKSKDIIEFFGASKVRTIGNDRLRFEIGGNNHRMIIKYQFGQNILFFYIKFIGTREEYNQVNEHTIDLYK